MQKQDQSSLRDRRGRDLLFLGLGLALALLGLLVLYSSSAVLAARQVDGAAYYAFKQMGWFSMGLVALGLAAWCPLAMLRRLALPGMFVSLAALLLVFMPGIGRSVSSSRESFHRWLEFGPISFQPSEFAKLALVVYVAHTLSRRGRLISEYDMRRLLPPLILVGVLLLLIVIEPQYGTTICLLAVLGGMIYVSGFPMLRLVLLLGASLPLLGFLILFWEYRFERLIVWLDPYAYRHAGGYQLVTAFRAFAEGHLFGEPIATGFAHRYLTYGHTDFILALFAEDFGLVGVLALFVLYAAFLWRGVLLARSIEEPFAFMLAAGVLCMLVGQVLMNLAVVTGLAPTTGVSLPFISYGGSSLIVTMALTGLLFNVSRYSQALKTTDSLELVSGMVAR